MRRMTDVDEVMAWRREVIACVFRTEPSGELLEANREYFLRNGEGKGWIALMEEADGRGAGCGIICFREELPSPDNPSGRCAWLMNIYVRPEFRRQGVGRRIVGALVAEAHRRGCGRIGLETTPAGRALYLDAGFADAAGVMEYDCRKDISVFDYE